MTSINKWKNESCKKIYRGEEELLPARDQDTRLVQDYFLENLNKEGYFGRKATFYRLITDVLNEVFLTHTHGISPPLSAHARLQALKENRLKPD